MTETYKRLLLEQRSFVNTFGRLTRFPVREHGDDGWGWWCAQCKREGREPVIRLSLRDHLPDVATTKLRERSYYVCRVCTRPPSAVYALVGKPNVAEGYVGWIYYGE